MCSKCSSSRALAGTSAFCDIGRQLRYPTFFWPRPYCWHPLSASIGSVWPAVARRYWQQTRVDNLDESLRRPDHTRATSIEPSGGTRTPCPFSRFTSSRHSSSSLRLILRLRCESRWLTRRCSGSWARSSARAIEVQAGASVWRPSGLDVVSSGLVPGEPSAWRYGLASTLQHDPECCVLLLLNIIDAMPYNNIALHAHNHVVFEFPRHPPTSLGCSRSSENTR